MIRKILLIIYNKIQQGKYTGKRKLPLTELMSRSETRMKILPRCPYDNSVMVFRTSNIVYGTPCRDDIAFKCPECFHTSHFGIPISDELAKEEIDLRGSTHILKPAAFKLPESDKELIDRLKALGYLSA